MKTIREYLEMLNEPERSEAINNTLEHILNKTKYNYELHNILLSAFVWKQSDQGFKYWNNIYINLLNNTYNFENENNN